MPQLGHCDSAVGAPHLFTIKNASRATRRVNNFAKGKKLSPWREQTLVKRTSGKRKEKVCSSPRVRVGLLHLDGLVPYRDLQSYLESTLQPLDSTLLVKGAMKQNWLQQVLPWAKIIDSAAYICLALKKLTRCPVFHVPSTAVSRWKIV